nr:MAG TPA: hypothetical protein [Caudoviricetes sp.]
MLRSIVPRPSAPPTRYARGGAFLCRVPSR